MGAQTDSVRRQFATTMYSVGSVDEKLVVMVGDISHGILQPFAKAFPSRYFNIGILEPTMISMAAGMARTGLRVVAHTIAPFIIERSFEQLKLDFVYQGLPGNIVTVGGAFDYSNLGCTHHCYGDFALLKTLPGVQILNPSSPIEFDSLFRQAYAGRRMTVYKIAGNPHEVEFPADKIVLGKAIKVHEGVDLTLIAVGPQLRTALQIGELLRKNRKSADVIYVHSLRPLDNEMIRESVMKTRKVVVIEEHMKSGGLGDDVLRLIQQIPNVAFHSASIPDVFVHEYGSYEDLCGSVGLTAEAIMSAVEEAGFFHT